MLHAHNLIVHRTLLVILSCLYSGFDSFSCYGEDKSEEILTLKKDAANTWQKHTR